MVNFILKLGGFGTDRENREKIATYSSFLGVISNVLLSITKIVIGLISGSVSVLADGVNNVFDVMSAVVTIVGVKLSRKPPDREHPYGHGRIEYLAAMIICVFVFAVGVQFLFASVKRLRSDAVDYYSNLAFILILFSIAVKIYLSRFYKKIGTKISSAPLLATGADALGDVLVTSVVVLNIISNKFFHFHLDGVAGIIVSIFIIFSAISLIKDTISEIIGTRPDEELLENLKNMINSYPEVMASHDFRVVSFGPEDKFAVVDVEFFHEMDLYLAHTISSKIEREVGRALNLRLVIHAEPAGIVEEKYKNVEKVLKNVTKKVNGFLDFHDLIISSEIISFDAVIDGNKIKNQRDKNVILDRIKYEIESLLPGYKLDIRLAERF